MATRYPRWFIFVPVLVLLFAGVAAVAFALGDASGGPAAQADRSTMVPGHPELGLGWSAPSTLGGVSGQVAITIAKIDGSKLSLQTTDGWTQTIDAAGATITKGGQTISVSDLKVGDRITFREARQSDGTYKITTVQVLTSPTSGKAVVQGTIASKTATSLVVTTSAGKTVTVNVSSTTRYSVRGVASPTLADVAVGYRIAAQGTLNADGTLTATVVQAAPNDERGFGGFGPGGGIRPGGGYGPGGGSGGWRGRAIPLPSPSASAPNI
jgi:hypothetical protein